MNFRTKNIQKRLNEFGFIKTIVITGDSHSEIQETFREYLKVAISVNPTISYMENFDFVDLSSTIDLHFKTKKELEEFEIKLELFQQRN